VSSATTYGLISPVRDEEENLSRLAAAIEEQTVTPSAWVIIDNGSRDGTRRLADDLSERYPWVYVLSIPGDERAVPGAPIVRAFHAGVAALDRTPDVVVKLDADVSMSSTYFERLLGEFTADPSLGIAGGTCLELNDSEWSPIHTTINTVRGAVRAYRRECLEVVLPLAECVGWDGIDALKAQVGGWTTRTIPELTFFHHRKLGMRDGGRTRRWRAQGRGTYYMGYRFSYLAFRSIFHARRDPAALTMMGSYLWAAVTRKPRYGDLAVRAQLRESQSLRQLSSRLREARGGF
jgi:glycosyltransferase involved in cell wall biosynthesis